MYWLYVVCVCLLFSAPAGAGEILANVGSTQQVDSHNDSFGYQFEYREGLGENGAIGFSYLNEGHVPHHHRDGLAPLTLWGRTNILDRQLSLAIGVSPYLYADTVSSDTGLVRNDHGIGALASASATWYFKSRMLLQARVNYALTDHSINTVTAFMGIGYQLDAPAIPGPLTRPPKQKEKTTNNELTLFLGQTVVNNPGSPKSLAWSAEYRRGLLPYLDITAAWMNEGDNKLIRRNGAMSQLWLVRDFLDDHLALGGGCGGYISVDKRGGPHVGEGGSNLVSAVLSLSIALRNFSFDRDLSARFTMNRIVTNYDKDTDIFMAGIGYRF